MEGKGGDSLMGDCGPVPVPRKINELWGTARVERVSKTSL